MKHEALLKMLKLHCAMIDRSNRVDHVCRNYGKIWMLIIERAGRNVRVYILYRGLQSTNTYFRADYF